MKITRTVLLATVASASLVGCSTLWTELGGEARQGVSSSLVDYLYPNGQQPPKPEESIPRLHVPLRVGLAFVPSNQGTNSPGLSEADRIALLERVRRVFIDQDFIADIVVIPDTYLRGSKGFQGLEQVARLYQTSVMALVSYDQVAMTTDTNASFWYWTIVGAYLIEGTKNEVRTFVDTAIFDISSRRLLFRAPGIHIAEERSTLIKANEDVLQARRMSFDLAMDDMSKNLQVELDKFKVRIKEDPGVAQVVRTDGSGGGGVISALTLSFLLCVVLVALRRRQLSG